MMPESLCERYQEMQRYVGWSAEHAVRIRQAGPLLEKHLAALVDDFYAEIAHHPRASAVISGGPPQVERLKGTLLVWLRDLLRGPYDADYVQRRWRVGSRHVEIGLDQVYTNVALSRLRRGLMTYLAGEWPGDAASLEATRQSLLTLLDLDLAIIEDAYQFEYSRRQQRNERLAAIGQVAASIAHELRNPLNVVKTSVYFLAHSPAAPAEKVTEHLERIERHVRVADNAITALTDFARLPLPSPVALAVEPCLQAVLDSLQEAPEVEIEPRLPADLALVQADSGQLRLVFDNLVRNAIEAMPSGGILTITGRNVAGQVEIDIQDTGVGIAPEHLGHIAEPLYSTKARGLGLGLAIVRSILEKNQGNLRVVSQPGRGSTFTVVLPAAAAQSPRPP